MTYEDLNNKIKETRIEDYIWVIYIGIIILSWYSNTLERKYFIYNDLNSEKDYKKIITFIFFVLVLVYIYFFKNSLDDFVNLNPNDSDYKKKIVSLSFLASSFILLSGIIFLYLAIVDGGINVELAFN